MITVGVAHLEGLQVLSNMSQNNVREALSQFDRETRRNIDARLAGIEAAFDLGYLQAEEEGLSWQFMIFAELFVGFLVSSYCFLHG